MFEPFPPETGTDTAFLDRIHCYIPEWEIPKFRAYHFTNDYGFITDYLAEFLRELRKEQFLNRFIRLLKESQECLVYSDGICVTVKKISVTEQAPSGSWCENCHNVTEYEASFYQEYHLTFLKNVS